MANITFELALLGLMTDDYKQSVLRELGYSESDIAKARAQCSTASVPNLGSSVEAYGNLLGPAAKMEQSRAEVPDPFAGSVNHYFILSMWPHLYWVVNCLGDGRTGAVGFENQVPILLNHFDPVAVRVGLWTRASLEANLVDRELVDGWDERVVVEFRLGSRRFRGTFVVGLLQDWRSL